MKQVSPFDELLNDEEAARVLFIVIVILAYAIARCNVPVAHKTICDFSATKEARTHATYGCDILVIILASLINRRQSLRLFNMFFFSTCVVY